MKYDVTQQSIEEFVQLNWSLCPIQFDNVAFNSELYHEFLRCNIVFGEGSARTITQGCYRQVGLIMLSAFTKPGEGSARKLLLATTAADMIRKQAIAATLPLVAPVVKMQVPDLFNDNKERDGWVMAQVSCPFYYDF